jgi:hypothetical protein
MQLVPLAFIIGSMHHGIKGALRSEANLLQRAAEAEQTKCRASVLHTLRVSLSERFICTRIAPIIRFRIEQTVHQRDNECMQCAERERDRNVCPESMCVCCE